MSRARVLLAAALFLSSCGIEPRDSMTDAASPQAAEIDGLWLLSLWLGVAVWVVVMALLTVPVVRSWRRRRAATDAERGEEDGTATGPGGGRLSAPPAAVVDEPQISADPGTGGAAAADVHVRSRLLWLGGIVGPALILIVLLVASGRVGALTAHVEREGELVVEVVGHKFWWEVHYPEEGITTANEIHVPVDRPVRLRLFTADVIHSFWIPRVHGKIDMIPGQENWLAFEPEQTGRFRGNCAEFCGIAHAQMVAFLVVEEAEDFDAWVAAQQADAAEPDGPDAAAGQEVFIDAGCAACHAVRGTEATATVGPDLTHLMSRERLAAGIVPNTRENLAELVLDPWGVKPGNPMPPTRLDEDELEVLLDYLEALE